MSHIPEYPKCEDVYKLLLKVRGGGFTSKASKDGGVCLKQADVNKITEYL